MVQARARTFGSGGDGQGVQNTAYRQSILLCPEDFARKFGNPESIVVGIGKLGDSLTTEGDKRQKLATLQNRFAQ